MYVPMYNYSIEDTVNISYIIKNFYKGKQKIKKRQVLLSSNYYICSYQTVIII